MKRLLLFVAFLGIATIAVAASRPPVDLMIEGQHPRPGGDLELGSRTGLANGQTGQVRMKGNLIIEQPILPGSSVGVILDGGLTVVGQVSLIGNLVAGATTQAGTCTLNAASPSTCTATVRSGSKCVCTNVGITAAIAAAGVACSVTTTTLTATSANAAANVVNYFCF